MRAARLWVTLVFVCSAPLSSVAEAFTDVYFFGDSMTDTGKACSVVSSDFPSEYASGHCTNGPNWADYFAAGLGLAATTNVLGGTNYANGGDTTDDLDFQIDQFSPFDLLPADPDALYSIWLGGNDILQQAENAPTAVPSTVVSDAIANIAAGIERLASLGATQFMVVNIPDAGRAYGAFDLPASLGAVPFTAVQRDFLSGLSLAFNDQLALELETLRTNLGISILELDARGMIEEFFATPESFGIVGDAIDSVSHSFAFGVPCLVDAACSADPVGPIADQFIFFDAVHPTTAGHAELGSRALALVAVPEPGSAVLVGAGLLALRGRRTRELERARR